MEDKRIFKDLQINYAIKDREVRLIDENGNQMGVMATAEANRIADYRNLDLVKISPQANPPVCKLMDYGKHRFEQIKREKEAKKNQKLVELKEIQLSAVIDIGDIKTKAKKTIEILEDGNKVKLSIRMKGRQQAHPEISFEVIKSFYEMVKDVAVIEKDASQEGRNITMVIAPATKK